jgi:hypothetical protein
MAVVSTVMYSQNFTNGNNHSAQCAQWQNFLTQLTIQNYTLLKIQGTYDTVGLSINDSTVIGNIALALRTSGSYGPVSSNGVSWVVDTCGSGMELTTNSGCACINPGYSIRPCIGNSNFGALNSATCNGTFQTMTVILQY